MPNINFTIKISFVLVLTLKNTKSLFIFKSLTVYLAFVVNYGIHFAKSSYSFLSYSLKVLLIIWPSLFTITIPFTDFLYLILYTISSTSDIIFLNINIYI